MGSRLESLMKFLGKHGEDAVLGAERAGPRLGRQLGGGEIEGAPMHFEDLGREGGLMGEGGVAERAGDMASRAGEWATEDPYRTLGLSAAVGASGAYAKHKASEESPEDKAKRRIHSLLAGLGLG